MKTSTISSTTAPSSASAPTPATTACVAIAGPIHFDLYLTAKQFPSATYMVRSTRPPDALTADIRQVIRRIDLDLPMTNIRTQRQQIAANLQQERMFAALTTGFGILALLLATVGIYGIMAYTVTQRTNEIGIRLAFGAKRPQVRAMVLREAAWLSLLGVAIGMAAVLALVRLVKTMLYGLQPRAPSPSPPPPSSCSPSPSSPPGSPPSARHAWNPQ